MDSSVLKENKNGKISVSIAAMSGLELLNPQFLVLIETISVYEGSWAKTCSLLCGNSPTTLLTYPFSNTISLSNVQMNSIIEVHKFRPLQLGLSTSTESNHTHLFRIPNGRIKLKQKIFSLKLTLSETGERVSTSLNITILNSSG